MASPPRLLLFAEDFNPPDHLAGGVQVCVFQQVLHLSRRWRVTVVAPIQWLPPLARYSRARRVSRKNAAARASGFDLPGVRILRPRYVHVPLLFPITEPLQLLLIGLWAWLWHARDTRVVHGHRIYPMGLAAVLVGHALRLPAVLTAHGSGLHTDVPKGRWRIRLLSRFALRHADRVVTVSRDLFDIARGIGVDERRLRYIPNGVDPEAFAAGDAEVGRRLTGLRAGRRTIVSVGQLERVKGHTILIEAFRQLRQKRPEVALVIAGDGTLRAQLEEQIRAGGLGDDVRLLGSVSYRQVPDLLAAADIVALPSLNEGMPLAAIEALAAGRPLVGSAVGGTPEVVDHDRHGLLVPPGDAEALAAALDAALARAWDKEALRERARRYSWAIIAEDHERVYAELSDAAPQPG